MIGRVMKNARSAVAKAAKARKPVAKPAPRKQFMSDAIRAGGGAAKKPVGPAKPVGGGFKPKMPIVPPKMPTTGGGTRGNVEQNYRGIPNLVNATAPVPARGGFGAGFGGGAGMAKAPPMAKALPRISSLGKSVARSMMKKGGAVKKAAAKKRMP